MKSALQNVPPVLFLPFWHMPRRAPAFKTVTVAGRKLQLALKRTPPSGSDKSLFKNVVKSGKRWTAFVTRNGKKYYLKGTTFEEDEEAATAIALAKEFRNSTNCFFLRE